jgi:Orsellinic acid/F9775 biosynthesis cluster protein D
LTEVFDLLEHHNAHSTTFPLPVISNHANAVVEGLPVFEGYACPFEDTCHYTGLSNENLRQHLHRKHETSMGSLDQPIERVYAQVLRMQPKKPAFRVAFEPPDDLNDDNNTQLPVIAQSLTYRAHIADANSATQLTQSQFISQFQFAAYLPHDYQDVVEFMKQPTDPESQFTLESLYLLGIHFIKWIGTRLTSQPGEMLQLIHCRQL